MPITNFIWDEVDDTVLMETDEAGNTTAMYTHEPGPFGGLISERRDNQSRYYHYDALGSTRHLTNAAGQVTDSFLYNAFGNTVQHTGNTFVPYHFVGRMGYYHDDELAQYYVRARQCVPLLGLWLSADPARYAATRGYSITTTLYRYADNGPLVYADPTGLITVDEAVAKCERQIRASRGESGWTVIPGGTIGGGDKQECEKAIPGFLSSSSVQRLWRQYDNIPSSWPFKPQCRRPEFDCQCCRRWEKVGEDPQYEYGSYNRDWRNPKITICWNAVKADAAKFVRALVHELTHALQECRGRGDDTCGGSLAREIEARVCEGACSGFDDCLTKALFSSCSDPGYCDDPEKVRASFDAVQKWHEAYAKVMPYSPGGFCMFYPRRWWPDVPPNCFPEGTPVCVPNGFQPIDRLDVGDWVLAFDFRAGTVVHDRIVRTHLAEALSFRNVDVRGESLRVTSQHPFYVLNRGWTLAIDLARGDRLLSKGGSNLEITAVRDVRRTGRVFNISVGENENFFVGERALLVHNK